MIFLRWDQAQRVRMVVQARRGQQVVLWQPWRLVMQVKRVLAEHQLGKVHRRGQRGLRTDPETLHRMISPRWEVSHQHSSRHKASPNQIKPKGMQVILRD